MHLRNQVIRDVHEIRYLKIISQINSQNQMASRQINKLRHIINRNKQNF